MEYLPAYADPEPHQVDRPVVAASISLVTEGGEYPPHRHRKAQLLYTVSGVITCETERGVWMVPPGCAVWIPGGMSHRARPSGKVRGYALFVEPDAVAGLPERCCSVAVSVLLQALIDRACQLPRLYEPQGADGRIMSVLLDELVAAPLEQLHLPRPSDPRLLKLTDAMLADPADSASLPQWAARIGMSERSMSRLFRQQTGMSVARWRRQWHVIAGLQRLTSGLSVQTVAYELGYDSASAFVTMFKKAVGKPPGRFLAERTGAASEPEPSGFP
ncbi:AraC family transcriptional regulator [Achromobacter denitrificans]|uniref:AraC family transcriptional regulator n=1 Tax=Achromobacter denitrificans TaxID=32002 RepID=UPI000F66E277|nr:helix-turn-helix transcriptional regulator [Achromobacter denitrificans]MDF3943651.1 helix-turn-helix transcriptional regulator [Achromobacter denitrificans]RSE82047.1 AraC family transcriptional regulator [Achromobacter denitrificans]